MPRDPALSSDGQERWSEHKLTDQNDEFREAAVGTSFQRQDPEGQHSVQRWPWDGRRTPGITQCLAWSGVWRLLTFIVSIISSDRREWHLNASLADEGMESHRVEALQPHQRGVRRDGDRIM